MRSRATLAWASYVLIAGALAAYAVIAWLAALIARAPVLYGEGAIANAAHLARDGVAYLDVDPQRFVAANYPPLYLHVASIGDAFVTGRIVSILGTLAVAAMVFLSAQPAGRLAAAALATGWLALAPVMVWGPAVKPDLLALVLTAGGVVGVNAKDGKLLWSYDRLGNNTANIPTPPSAADQLYRRLNPPPK